MPPKTRSCRSSSNQQPRSLRRSRPRSLRRSRWLRRRILINADIAGSGSSSWGGCGFTRLLAVRRLVFALLLSATLSDGYTVLTHEAIVDSVWDTSLRQLLLKRFPGATPEELERAHAYAYGGCIIQDLGYYPL